MITPLPGYKVDPANPNGVVPIVPGTSPAVAQQPVVAPGTAPQTGSLQNTMTTPTVPTPATPTIPSNPAVPQAPAQGLPQGQFGALLGQVQQNLQNNNNLISQRQLLLKHLFDAPLTPDQLAKLPPDQQSIINAGDKNAIELQVRVLNDQLQGRANSLSSSVKYLTDAYKTDIDTAEKKKQDAIDNVLHFAQAYGDQAGAALKQLYGQDYLDTLKAQGINVDKFGSLKTLAQKSDEEDRALAAAKAAAGSGSGNSNQMTDNERALFNQFNGEPIVKDFNTILAKKLSVDSILNSKLGGPGDLAVVYEFMKGLDPSSVVRETEYESAAKSGNIFAGTLARFNGYLKPNGGFLPDAVKSSFQSIVNSKLKVQQQLYDNVKKQYQGVATRQGLNPENVVVDYSAANTGSSSSGSGKFDDIKSSITIEGQTAYLPRSVWAGVADKDGLLQEAKNDGYTLLIKD